MASVNVRYFASLREALGSAEAVEWQQGLTLGQVRDRYPVVYRQMLIDASGKAVNNWLKKEPADPVLRDFRYIQYDQMFGKEYSSRKFFPAMQASKPAT